MKTLKLILLVHLLFFSAALTSFAQNKDILSAEERLWLKERGNTIEVFPAEKNPPYSYKNFNGNPEGLAIDYLELIAKKLGIKVHYLPARSKAEILTAIQQGEGDVIAVVTPDPVVGEYLVFTDSYASSPSVIVIRKDYSQSPRLDLFDFHGKRVAVVKGSVLGLYIRTNHPKVIIEEMADNGENLERLLLGEVDGVAIDVASISYFLSKQLLNGIKIGGDIGFEYKRSFGIPKEKAILRSILQKGLAEVSSAERSAILDKWAPHPLGDTPKASWIDTINSSFNAVTFYMMIGLAVLIAIIAGLLKPPKTRFHYFRRRDNIKELKEELSELEEISEELEQEVKEVKKEEERLQDRIESLK